MGGEAGQRFPKKMGEYFVEGDREGYPYYKKVNSVDEPAQYLFVFVSGTHRYWGVSKILGGKQSGSSIYVGILNPTTDVLGSPPPATGWQYKDKNHDEADDDLMRWNQPIIQAVHW